MRSPSGRTVFNSLPVLLPILTLQVHYSSECDAARRADSKVKRMEARNNPLKTGGENIHELHEMLPRI